MGLREQTIQPAIAAPIYPYKRQNKQKSKKNKAPKSTLYASQTCSQGSDSVHCSRLFHNKPMDQWHQHNYSTQSTDLAHTAPVLTLEGCPAPHLWGLGIHKTTGIGKAIRVFEATDGAFPLPLKGPAQRHAAKYEHLVVHPLYFQMEGSSHNANTDVWQPLKCQGVHSLSNSPHQCRRQHLSSCAKHWQHSSLPRANLPSPSLAGACSSNSHRHTCIWTTTILPFSISIFIDFWDTHFWDVWYHWIILFSNLFVSLFMHWIDSFFFFFSTRPPKKDAATVVIWLSQQLT